VKVADALQAVTRLFLDTAPIIYFVERNPAYAARVDEVFDRIDAGTVSAVTSPITLAECLIVPVRQGLAQVQKDFTDLIVSGANVTFVKSDDAVARQAAELRVRYNLTLTDAFQIATSLVAGCHGFLTNDLTLKRVQEIPILVVDELEA
jgi:predicted nucleic acid-binding protein